MKNIFSAKVGEILLLFALKFNFIPTYITGQQFMKPDKWDWEKIWNTILGRAIEGALGNIVNKW